MNTKIVATVGPASSARDKLDRLILKHKEKQQDHHAPRVVTDAL